MTHLHDNTLTRFGRTWAGFAFVLLWFGLGAFLGLYGVIDALETGAVPCPGRCRGQFSQVESPLLYWGIVTFLFGAAALLTGLATLYAVRFLRGRAEP